MESQDKKENTHTHTHSNNKNNPWMYDKLQSFQDNDFSETNLNITKVWIGIAPLTKPAEVVSDPRLKLHCRRHWLPLVIEAHARQDRMDSGAGGQPNGSCATGDGAVVFVSFDGVDP